MSYQCLVFRSCVCPHRNGSANHASITWTHSHWFCMNMATAPSLGHRSAVVLEWQLDMDLLDISESMRNAGRWKKWKRQQRAGSVWFPRAIWTWHFRFSTRQSGLVINYKSFDCIRKATWICHETDGPSKKVTATIHQSHPLSNCLTV